MSIINSGTTHIPIPDSAYARWRRCKELSYYTAWQQTQPRNYHNPSPNEEILNKEAVLMLTLIAALDYCIYDLIEEMEEVGKYRHAMKHNINKAKDLILHAHDLFYRNMLSFDNKGVKQYNIASEKIYATIQECVSLNAPERAYNIIVAIVRLQEKQMTLLAKDNFFYFPPSQELSKIPGLLSGLGIEDHHLDDMLERNVRPIIMERRYAEQ